MENIRKSDSQTNERMVLFTSNPLQSAHRKRALRGRRLVLVDLENVVGGAIVTIEQAVRARRSIEGAVHLSSSDHVVIGTGPTGLLPAGLCWPGSRLVMGAGKDGADLALLDVLSQERVEERFDEVVLVSGDGIFTESVAAVGASGVDVTVVALVGSCSKRLRMAAGRTLLLSATAADLGGVA